MNLDSDKHNQVLSKPRSHSYMGEVRGRLPPPKCTSVFSGKSLEAESLIGQECVWTHVSVGAVLHPGEVNGNLGGSGLCPQELPSKQQTGISRQQAHDKRAEVQIIQQELGITTYSRQGKQVLHLGSS